jgi:hypothetical protein
MAVSGRGPDPGGPTDIRPPYLRKDGLFAYERIVGLEARAGWALGPGLAAFLPPHATPNDVLIPFIIELGDQNAAEATIAFVKAVFDRSNDTVGSRLPGIRAPFALDDTEKSLEAKGIYTMALSPAYFFELASPRTTREFQAFRAASKRIELGLPMRAVARP